MWQFEAAHELELRLEERGSRQQRMVRRRTVVAWSAMHQRYIWSSRQETKTFYFPSG
jgi:hypothetical protein